MSNKEEIKKIEEAFRIKKPKALDSKRSAFLKTKQRLGGVNDCLYDIVVAVDVSGSVGYPQNSPLAQAQNDFISSLITYWTPQMNAGEIQMGICKWSTGPYPGDSFLYQTSSNKWLSNNPVELDVIAQAVNGTGTTHILSGLLAAETHLNKAVTDTANCSLGDRTGQPGFKRVVIFVTDADLFIYGPIETQAQAMWVNNTDIYGVRTHHGTSPPTPTQESAWRTALQPMCGTDTTPPGGDYNYTAAGTIASLNSVAAVISSSVCTGTGECYDIGDTGPEGGIIFAVPLGHPQNNGVNQTNFYYEVAKNDIATGGTPSSGYAQTCGTPSIGGWAVAGAEWGVHNKSNITTSTDFGTGHKNTDAIHAYPLSPGNPTGGIHPWLDTHDIAATLCKQYPSANNDWFLPSLDEFAEMVDASITHGFNLGLNTHSPQDMKHVYWTSSQWRNDPANGLVIANPDLYSWGYMGASQFQPAGPNLAYRCHALSVRPIRRFECDPEPSCNGCDCIEYNYRDYAWAMNYGTFNNSPVHCQLVGHLGSMTGPSFYISPLTQWNYVVNGLDSVIGDNVIALSIAAKDVMGNEFTLTDWQDDSIGYTITVWDRWYNFLGKWKYDNFIYGRPTEGLSLVYPNISHPELPDRLYFFLDGVTHLDGPSSIVNYDIGPNGGSLSSVTGAFFKIEAACNTNLSTAFESGCNHIEPYLPNSGASYHPMVCLWENAPSNFPMGIANDCLLSYGTYSPPTYYLPGNNSCQNSACAPCTYQVGDIGPGGGIIVAVPYMNVNSPADGCVGPIVPALQGMPLKNYTDYYYEISPQNLNTPTDIIVFGNAGMGVTGINLDANTNYVIPDTSVTYCPPINPSSNINNEYIGQGEQATGDIMSTTGGNPTSAFPGNYQTVENAFKACSDYQSNGYTDWFLPTTQEMEFARNYSPLGTLQDTGSLQTWLNYYWTCNTVVNTTAQLSRIQEPFPTSIGTPDNFAFAVSSDPISTNSGPHGYGWRTLLNRRYWLNVRAMRKFKCITNSSTPNNKRSKFIEKRRTLKDVGPFGVAGYYPLYGTIDGATKASPESSYHIHQFGDVEYYMPNGLEMGVTQFHGDWEPDNEGVDIGIITGPDNFTSGQADEVIQPEEQVVQPEQQLPDEPEETPPSIEPNNEGY